MNSGLFSINLPWWILLLQSTVCLMLGLMGSFLFRRKAARAHQALMLGIISALLVPFLSILVNHYGLGFLKAEPLPGKLVTRKPVESKSIATKAVEHKAIAGPIINDTPLSLNDELLPSSDAFRPLSQEPSVVKIETPAVTGDLIDKISWTHVLMGIWILVSLALLLRLIRTFILGIRLLRAAEPLDNVKLNETLFTACTKLGVRHNIDIRVSQTVHSPIIWCWSSRPILLVPAGTESLTRHTDWLGLFCHEIAHWKRLDHLVGLGTELAVSLIWWHPLLWWAKQRLLCLSEQACDDWVMDSGQAGPDYAELLLTLLPEGRMAFVPTVVGKENTMKKRIHRIIKQPGSNPRVGSKWALITLIITLSVVVGTALAQRRPARVAQQKHQERMEQREELVETIGYLESRTKETDSEIKVLEKAGRGNGIKARILHDEVRRMHERIGDLVQELHALGGQRDLHQAENSPPINERQQQLAIRAEEIHHTLQELGDRDPDKSEQLEMELHEIHARLAEIESQASNREMDRPNPERQQLEKRAEEIQNIMHELGDRDPDRAKQLEMELREIHDRLAEIGAQTRERDMDRPNPERQQLEKRAEDIHNILRELGGRDPQRTEQLEMELREIHAQLTEIESQAREREMDRPQPEQPNLEHQVQELNGQVDQLSREMQEIRELLRQLVEQKQR